MSDIDTFLKENPHIKLDTDMIEQVPVQKNTVQVDEDGNPKVITKTVMEQQTVRYMHVPKVKMRCNTGDHVFRILDNRKYLFACTLCPFVRKVYPGVYRFEEETGALIHTQTGSRV